MTYLKRVSFMLCIISIIHLCKTLPIKRRAAQPQRDYHVGHIVEHAYATELTETHQSHNHHHHHHHHQHQFYQNAKLNSFKNPETRPLVAKTIAPSTPYLKRNPTPTTTTTTTTATPFKHSRNTGDINSGLKVTTQKPEVALNIKSKESSDEDDNNDRTETSLAALLAMLEVTRDPQTSQKKQDETRTTISIPNPTWPFMVQPSTSPTPMVTPLIGIGAKKPDWSVYDHLDTRESNETSTVLESEQKFGYVVNGNDHKRFRIEGKSPSGLITGLFGIHHNDGNIRGVQYTADPSINPKFLYDTLVKFLSS